MTASAPAPRVIDASTLPSHGYGAKAPIWWATVLLVLMELTTFALFFASTLFLREGYLEWPTKPDPPLLPAALGVAIGAISLAPMVLAARAARRKDLRPTRRWMLITTALAAAWVAARLWEMATLPWTWMTDAHASCVWMTMGLHGLELVAGLGECVFLCVLLVRGPLEDHHSVDVDVNAVFWGFVVAVWAPFFALFDLVGRGP